MKPQVLSATPTPALYEAICDGYRTFGFKQHRRVAEHLNIDEQVVEHAWNEGWGRLLGDRYGPIGTVLATEHVRIAAEMEQLRRERETEEKDIRDLAARHIARTREHELGVSARFRKVAQSHIEAIERVQSNMGPVVALLGRQLEEAVTQAAQGAGPLRDVHATLKAVGDVNKLTLASVSVAKSVMELERLRLTGLPDLEGKAETLTPEEALIEIARAQEIAAAAAEANAISVDELRKYGTLPEPLDGESEEIE